MSDEKKAPETRTLTITLTAARVTREQADRIVEVCASAARVAREVSGVEGLTMTCTAPVSTSDGGAPSDAPCECPVCSIRKAIMAAIVASEGDAPASAPDGAEHPAINAIPARGPWGAS